MVDKTPEFPKYLENLLFLRHTVIPAVQRQLEAEPSSVSFHNWCGTWDPRLYRDDPEGKCGTYRCLGGWYHFMKEGRDLHDNDADDYKEDYIDYLIKELVHPDELAEDRDEAEHKLYSELFTSMSFVTMEHRIEALDRRIRSAMAKLEKSHVG